MDFFGLIVLILTALVVVVIQAGLALAAMFAMHKYLPHKFPETTFGKFNFDQFETKEFTELVIHVVLIFLIPTVVLHSVEFIVVGLQMRRAPLLVCFILLILETAAIAGGFHMFFKLDRHRLLALTGFSAVIYLLVLWLALYSKLT